MNSHVSRQTPCAVIFAWACTGQVHGQTDITAWAVCLSTTCPDTHPPFSTSSNPLQPCTLPLFSAEVDACSPSHFITHPSTPHGLSPLSNTPPPTHTHTHRHTHCHTQLCFVVQAPHPGPRSHLFSFCSLLHVLRQHACASQQIQPPKTPADFSLILSHSTTHPGEGKGGGGPALRTPAAVFCVWRDS